VDLTWIKEYDVDSKTSVEKDSQCLLTVIDQFSKYAWVRVLRNKTAKVVATALRNILADAGTPFTIRSDNGSEFIFGEFANVCSEFSIKHITCLCSPIFVGHYCLSFLCAIQSGTCRSLSLWCG
jgi:IS30 family transposase